MLKKALSGNNSLLNNIPWIYEIVEDKNIKNRSYYLFNDIIALKILDESNLKVDKKNYKHIETYYIGYITMKKKIDDYEKI